MNKTLLLLLLLGIGMVGMLLTNNSTKGQQTPQEEDDDEPTVVKGGQHTERERKYSIRYKKLYPGQNKKLSEGVTFAREKGLQGEIRKSLGIPSFPTVGKPPTDSEFIVELVCKSDAIVIGTSKNKTAHLTDDETWVYTEYDFTVHDVVKNNQASPIAPSTVIKITRPGGLVKLDNQVIRVEDRLYKQLRKNKTYLLFLSYERTTEGYLVADFRGDFVLEGQNFEGLAVARSFLTKAPSQALLSDIRNATLSKCPQIQEGG